MAASKKSAQAAKRARWRAAVASVIAQTRRDADKSQEEVAAALGWSRNKQQKLEAGLIKIEPGDLIMLAQALGTDPERLFRRVLSWNA